MNLVRKAIADLHLDPANARLHPERNRAAIQASLKRFGQQKPIVITPAGMVIAGNGTLEAARAIGWTEIDCVVSDLDGIERTAFGIADNRTSELAAWDDTVLTELLDHLKHEGFDLDDAGFTDAELEAMLKAEQEPADIEEDEVPEPPADPVTKPGDLWLLGDHRLLCGDSTKAEDVERLMDGAKADLCFTSPPYNLGKSVGLRNGARKGAASAYNDMNDCGEEWPTLMRGFIRCAMTVAAECAINVQLLSGNKMDLLRLMGEHAANTIDVAVWVKTNPQPAMADGVMTSAFEFVWILSGEDNPSRRIRGASFSRGTFLNVFQHATASGHDASVHGAVFPIAVAGHFIQGLSALGASVYEPFCGSGTTLIAAEQLGRKCYGMEISPAYCDVIVNRWEALTGKKAVLGSVDE